MGNIHEKRIALVGGAGFIGHHLALKLKELGAEVFVIDSLEVNNYYSFKSNIDQNPNAKMYLGFIKERLDLIREKNIPLLEVDARDYHKLSETFNNINPDILIHLAAVAHAGKSNKDPYSTFDHSLRTLENSLDISRSPDLKIKKFIYFSSSMVYGNFMSDMVTEESNCNPLGIYGALKYAGEKIVVAYNQVFNLNYTIIRPSALYGERCVSRRVGQIFIENALQGQRISVQGDGSDRLDFTYIDDLVSGVLNVIENDKSINQIFNITYGKSRSIGDLAKVVAEHFPEIKVDYLPKDKLMPERGTLCVDKAKGMIGYQPRYPIEKGFVNYIKWYKEFWKKA